mgnify:CR=1 FL=1
MNRYSLLIYISVCILTRITPIHAQEFIEDDEKISIYKKLKQSSSNWFNGFESTLEGTGLIGSPIANMLLEAHREGVIPYFANIALVDSSQSFSKPLKNILINLIDLKSCIVPIFCE